MLTVYFSILQKHQKIKKTGATSDARKRFGIFYVGFTFSSIPLCFVDYAIVL
jgi:hypothetical protein